MILMILHSFSWKSKTCQKLPRLALQDKTRCKSCWSRVPKPHLVLWDATSGPPPSGSIRTQQKFGVWFTLVGSRPLGQCPVQRWTEPATVKVFKQTTNVLFQNKHLKITEFFEIPTLAKSARFMVVALDFQQIQTYLFWNSQVQLRSKLHVHLIGRIHERPWDFLEKVQWQYQSQQNQIQKDPKGLKKHCRRRKTFNSRVGLLNHSMFLSFCNLTCVRYEWCW